MKANRFFNFGAGAALALACLPVSTVAGSPDPRPDSAEPLVQLALLLDTSNSMDGLIEQAKSQLWKIVNEFIGARRDGRPPVVQVALYEYGNDRLSITQNYVRQVCPLTRDLDAISRELFALRTCGGSEFCGTVVQRAVEELSWDPSSRVYKAIFIAGNEPFTQGPVDPRRACQGAIGRGIVVNTIHCGPEWQGVQGCWRTGAEVAEGKFLVIDQDRAIVHIPAPQDVIIERLNIRLNDTYIPYGHAGAEGKANQLAQDNNALAQSAAGASVSRVASKASRNYHNDRWDLVDASKRADFRLGDLKAGDLPPEMRSMTPEQQLDLINRKKAERDSIQKEILELNEQRKRFVAEKEREKSGAETLDSAIVQTIRAQAGAKGYRFE
jgi:hypothetical protein